MEIRTATPEMLVVKLYEGMLRFIRMAKDAGGKTGASRRAESISRAMAIVNELQQCLNMDAGGEIATNLDALYTYMTERLVDANVDGDEAGLDDCLRVLEPLQQAWVEIAKNPREAGQAPGSIPTEVR